MMEVEKILEQLEDFPKGLSRKEMENELNQRSRLLGIKQRDFSMNSEEYKEYGRQRDLVEKALKILRDKAKEESALVALKEPKEDGTLVKKKTGYEESMVEEWENGYKNALKEKDEFTLQKIYGEVSRYAERGNAQAINMLAVFAHLEQKNKAKVVRLFYEAGKAGFSTAKRNLSLIKTRGVLCKKNVDMARELLEESASEGNAKSILDLALEHLGVRRDLDYIFTDRKKAYSFLKQYLQKVAPLDMKNNDHRQALYLLYKTGYELEMDMAAERSIEPLKLLFQYPGKYTEEAKGLEGVKLSLSGDYERAIQTYLEHQTLDSIKALKGIFFNQDFASNRERQRQLDKELENLRDDENINKDIRIELYGWYGWRYEYGKAKLEERSKAFWCYYMQYLLSGTKSPKLQEMMEKALDQMDSVLLEEVIEQGAYDLSVDAGFIYRRRRIYDKALAHYRMAYEYAEDFSVRERAKKNFEILKRKVDRQQKDMAECEPVYRQFMATGLGKKLDSFKKMQSMIYRGKNNQDCNTYACLRVAQIVETDAYIQDCLKNEDALFSNEKILWLYQQTEDGDFEEGIQKLYEIYSKGLYGKAKNTEKADYYKNLLA